jgi:hypothetical protein
VFIERDYALPKDRLTGKSRVRIRFLPETGFTAGPIFGCRILAAGTSIGVALTR